MSGVMTSKCPICGKNFEYDPAGEQGESRFPFCGERCKLIDLGRWLDGKYQIPVEDDDEGDGPSSNEEP